MSKFEAAVSYHEMPGQWTPLHSLNDDGLYATEASAKGRITRELQDSWKRGLTVAESRITRIDPLR